MTKLANELHKSFRKRKQLRRIYFPSKDNIWNADLIIMPQESDYKYILQILFTKWFYKIGMGKRKKRKPNKLFVDEGKEFYNQHMYDLFKFKKEDILEKDENGEYKKRHLFCL